MTPGWSGAFRFAASEAERLGMELTIASSPGWSETGGPWVPPADGMKKLVWSETDVAGGKRFTGRLAPVPATTGPYQDLAANDPLAAVFGQHEPPARQSGNAAAVAHENGLKLYGEALEDVRPTLGDDMAMRQYTDVLMAALWTWGRGTPRPTPLGDMKSAPSVAHLYGQNLTTAKSMTAANAPWAFAPADLRTVVDLEFA